MNSPRRHFLETGAKVFAAAIVWTSSNATAADGYVPFQGEVFHPSPLPRDSAVDMALLAKGYYIDPWLKDQTRVVEKRYKQLGGKITVLVTQGEGHFPVSRKDPKPVVDFILSHQG